jgi:hypothetical protein
MAREWSARNKESGKARAMTWTQIDAARARVIIDRWIAAATRHTTKELHVDRAT